ncbi:hypothetical protein [Prevotella sp. P6B1]|uniref:hypothetical protein n=1 Tax=Prevotella sp. P6B1 TaxID=1410613 RepID=UPI00051BC036|nr:hypothetical protein [Prevotella sp. P6B1]
MKKKPTEKNLQKFWDEHIGELAYDMEEAFLDVFRKRGPEFENPSFLIGSIAMASGHILQVLEKELNYQLDLKPHFNDILMKSYNHYRQFPSDEGQDSESNVPDIDISEFS